MDETVARDLAEKVLQKLGFSRAPSVDLAGLAAVYGAWCRRVPFDNVRKLIHVRAKDASPLPGGDPNDFFQNWLRHGTGGTCWASNGALQALLVSLGFPSVRGVGTMLVVPNLPPNHGTVVTAFDGVNYLTDASMLHDEPLPLVADAELTHGAWRARMFERDGHSMVAWFPLMRPEGLDCKINHFPAAAGEFNERHEATRDWSPFNYELNTRKIIGDRTVGIVLGGRAEFNRDGKYSHTPLDANARLKCMIEELGYSEEIARQVPPDEKTPPPPGSKTALEAAR